jgi:hypothetical protein
MPVSYATVMRVLRRRLLGDHPTGDRRSPVTSPVWLDGVRQFARFCFYHNNPVFDIAQQAINYSGDTNDYDD